MEEEDHGDEDDDGDFREGGEPAPMETMARINVRQDRVHANIPFAILKQVKLTN